MEEFIDFDPGQSDQLLEMLNAAENFVGLMHSGVTPRWLSLLGSTGAGKTMLAQRIMRWARKYQEGNVDPSLSGEGRRWTKRCGMLKWSKCCDWMVNGDYGWIPQAKEDWLVCLDDIGAEYEKIKALATSKLYEILEARRGKWTIITANLTVDDIEKKLDARIASRLFRDESDVIEVDAEDYNIRKFKERKGK